MREGTGTKRDWTLFRTKLADWQEAHMDRLCMEYMQLLSGDGAPSERFWQLYERIMADKRSSGVQLRLSRSKLLESILWLIDDGVITVEDLEDFSDELKETVNTCMAIRRWEDPDEEQLPNRPTE